MDFRYGIASLLLSSSLWGETLDLHKVFSETLKNNHLLKSAYQKEKISDLRENEAFSSLLPSLHAIVTKNRYLKSTTSNSTYKNYPTSYDGGSYELKLTQPLFNVAAYNEYTKSQISAQIAKLEYYTAIQEKLIEVVTAYIELLLAQEKLIESTAKVTTLNEQLLFIQKRFDLGDATMQDLTDTNAKYFLAQSNQLEVKLSLELAKANLEKYMGSSLDPYDQFEPIEIYNEADIEIELSELIKEAFENNLALQVKKLFLEYSVKNIQSKKGGYYPTVDLIGSVAYNEYELGATNSEDYHTRQNYLGLQVVAPLYEGGSTIAKVDIAQEEMTQAKEELESSKQDIQYKIIKEYQGLKTIQSQIKSYTVALQSANLALESAKVGYDLGIRTQYEVLQSIEQVYGIKNSILDLKHKYKIGQLSLKYLLGNLSGEDLKN